MFNLRRRINLVLIAVIVLTASFIAPASVSAKSKGLKVHFIDVGQGDATLITCNGESMMIDFGNNYKGTAIQNYLNKQKVKKLKYAIGTHPDADHIGGMDVILYKFATKNVFMPNVANDTATYRDVVDTCKARGYKIKHPKASKKKKYKLGGATFQILAPSKKSYSDINSYSYVIKLTYKKTSFLFTGDAPVSSENEMIKKKYNLKADVLKVGHHGSYTSTSKKFLKKVKPKFAVISACKDNTYGHPHSVVMKRLKKQKLKLFRTDLQGTVVAKSNGKKITWSVKPSKNYKGNKTQKNDEPQESSVAPEVKPTETETQQAPRTTPVEPSTPTQPTVEDQTDVEKPAEWTFILNTNSKKFHKYECSGVKRMSAANKEYTTKTEEELVAEGYDRCGICWN